MGETKPVTHAIPDEAVQKIRDSRVTIVADFHSDMRIHSTAFDLASKSGSSMGLEFLAPTHQPSLDAFSRGDITREQFLKTIMSGSHPGANSPEAYMGEEKANAFYNQIADFIAQGGKIHAVGTNFGMMQYLDNEAAAKTKDRIGEIDGQMNVSKIIFLNQNSAEMQADPKGFATLFLQKLDEQSKSWPADIQKRFVEDVQNIRDMESRYGTDIVFDKALVESFYCYTMPDLMAERSRLQAQDISNENDHIKSGKPNRPDVELRQMADKFIADKIKDVLTREDKPLLVVYGVAHTTHDGDIDYHLRLGGISTTIFDLLFKEKPGECAPDVTDAEDCKDLKLLREWIDAERTKDGDPSRYTLRMGFDGPDPAMEPLKVKPALQQEQPTVAR